MENRIRPRKEMLSINEQDPSIMWQLSYFVTLKVKFQNVILKLEKKLLKSTKRILNLIRKNLTVKQSKS